MDAERLVKISRDNIPAGRRSPGQYFMFLHRWEDFSYNYLPLFSTVVPSKTSKTEVTSTPTRSVDNVVITTKRPTGQKHKYTRWDDGGK